MAGLRTGSGRPIGAALEAAASQIGARREAALDAGAAILTRAIVEKLSTPGRGTVYGNHRASAPGDPPAVDSNRLRGSIAPEKTETGRVVGTNVEYAEPLEFGTPTIEPRPFMRPAFLEARDAIDAAVIVTLKRGGV